MIGHDICGTFVTMALKKEIKSILTQLGVKSKNESVFTGRNWITALNTKTEKIFSPTDGEEIGSIVFSGITEYEAILKRAVAAKKNHEID